MRVLRVGGTRGAAERIRHGGTRERAVDLMELPTGEWQ